MIESNVENHNGEPMGVAVEKEAAKSQEELKSEQNDKPLKEHETEKWKFMVQQEMIHGRYG